MKEVENHIWFNEEVIQNSDGIWKEGYYFSDEAEQLNGPYASQKEAKADLARYCDTFLKSMSPYEKEVQLAYQAVMDGFGCPAPDDEYCGGCANLMRKFEEAVRSHERSLVYVPTELRAAQQVIAFYACVIKSGERWSPACETAMQDALASLR
jgi:hypothetical protein